MIRARSLRCGDFAGHCQADIDTAFFTGPIRTLLGAAAARSVKPIPASSHPAPPHAAPPFRPLRCRPKLLAASHRDYPGLRSGPLRELSQARLCPAARTPPRRLPLVTSPPKGFGSSLVSISAPPHPLRPAVACSAPGGRAPQADWRAPAPLPHD